MIRRISAVILRLEWLFLLFLLLVTQLGPGRITAVLLLIPFLWLLRRLATGHFVPPTPLNWSLWLLLLMVLVSQYATFDMAFSYGKIAGLLYGVAVFFALVAWVGRSARRFWLAVGGLLGGGLVIAALGLLVAQTSRKIPVLGSVIAQLPSRIENRLTGSEGINPNQIAGILLWMTPLAITLLVGSVVYIRQMGRRWPVWLLPLVYLFLAATAVILLGVLLLTQSRSAYVGLLVAGVFVFFAAIAAYSRKLLLAGLAVSALLLIFAATQIQPAQITENLFPQVGLQENALSTLNGRIEIWSRAIYGIQDFPFTGMGMNNFRRVVHILYPLFLISPNTDIAHAHNHLLQTALDLGIPGMIAYLAVWLGTAVMLWQVWRRADDPLLRLGGLGLMASLLAYFIYGLTDAVALGARPGFLFWYLFGLAAALHQIAINPAANLPLSPAVAETPDNDSAPAA
jgi:putative inorganic carbon (hco3(-)) transporter